MEAITSFEAIDASGTFEIPDFCYKSGEKMGRNLLLKECLDGVLLTTLAAYRNNVAVSAQGDCNANSNHLNVCDSSSFTQFLQHPPAPLGNFAMANNHFLLRAMACEKHGHNAVPVIGRTKFNSSTIGAASDLLFQAVLMEVVDNPQHFVEFNNSRAPPPDKTDVPLVPSLHEKDLLNAYQDFILTSPPSFGSRSSMSSLVRQFQNHFKSAEEFCQFFKALVERSASDIAELLSLDNDGRPRLNRLQVGEQLSEILWQPPDSEIETSAKFIVWRAMFALEEIYEGVFTHPTADDALVVLSNPDCQPFLETLYKDRPMKNPAKVISSMLQIINAQSTEYLACMGVKKENVGGSAIWASNSRPFNVYDVYAMFHMV